MADLEGLLLDIDGTLVEGGVGPDAALIGDAADTVRALAGRFALRYVTNTTSRPQRTIVDALRRLGFPASAEQVVTPAGLARRVLVARGEQRGILIGTATPMEDLDWFEQSAVSDARCVLVASEAHDRRIADLLPALDALHRSVPLYTLQSNRVYRRNGRLLPDCGPVAAYLAYAADVAWESFGKPSELLFSEIARELGVEPSRLAMVGDDAEFDVAGALTAGVGRGVLVRSGKFRPGDESRCEPRPTDVIDSVAELARILD